MIQLNKKQQVIDFLGLTLLGLFSLGYVFSHRLFAELHLQLPFLNFPIFVGEILLFICLILFYVKYRHNPQKLTKWHCLIICYFSFVIIKALCGYLKWGPLALRDSALLYYPAFVVFGYAFYRRDLFDSKRIFLLLILIISVFIFTRKFFYGYYTLTLVALGLILIASYPRKIIAILLLLLFFICIPCKEFFLTSRMMIVANLLSGLYLAAALPIILKIKKEFKPAVIILMAGVVIFGLLKFAPGTALKSIVNFQRMAKVFHDGDVQIQAKIKGFKMERRKDVKLYNPDRKVSIPKETTTPTIFSEEKMKTEVRQALVEQVKEKIEEFSFERIKNEVPESSVEEMKKEIGMVLAKNEPPEVAEPVEAPAIAVAPAPVVAAATGTTEGTAGIDTPREDVAEEVKEEPKLVLAQVEPPEVVNSLEVAEPVEAPAIAVAPAPVVAAATETTEGTAGTDTPKEDVAEEVKEEPKLVLAQVESPEVVNSLEVAEPVEAPAIVVAPAPVVAAATETTEGTAGTDTPKEKEELRQIFFERVKQEIQTASVGQGNEEIPSALVAKVKEEMQLDLKKGFERKRQVFGEQLLPSEHATNNTTGWVDNDNAVFRLFIWRDMLVELAKEKPILGFDFGKPLRSVSLEILNWGTGDWDRDGWIGAHNSYLDIIYRTGIVGILLIFSLLAILFKMIKQFIQDKSLTGILLCGIIINWFAAANFLLIFELPYTAIPIWTIYGLTFAYYESQLKKQYSPKNIKNS